MKRKRDEAHREEEEEEEVKKVCKEGLQLFHHNVCLLLFLQSDVSTREYDSQRRGRTPPVSRSLCVSRPPSAQRIRGGEAWRARGDAGRSRAAAGHERLSVHAARKRVRGSHAHQS